ncbi:MAG: hypothetical protein PHS28_05460 [Atopobiaceae bacterium]|jgi:hypothetical protein|nr:hypothetical protein [Atopobiaceae bacterium]
MNKAMVAGITGAALVVSMGLAGCGTASTSDSSSSAATTVEQKAPLDLTGEWKAPGSSDDTWMEATITSDTITVNWVSDSGKTKSLYFAGSYVAPTTSDDSYTWDSANDTSQTSKAMLATTVDPKTFSYADGKLSVEVSAMGTTKTVEFTRE